MLKPLLAWWRGEVDGGEKAIKDGDQAHSRQSKGPVDVEESQSDSTLKSSR